jgi:hypothetical protein
MARQSTPLLMLLLLALLLASVDCSEKDPVIPPETRIVTVPINAFRFHPHRTEGDCEFNAHGPDVTLRAKLTARLDSLLVGVYMKARETVADWSTAEDSVSYHVYTAPSGWRISRIDVTPNPCQKQYRDTNHAYHIDACGWVTFASVGDTDGPDICNTTADDTHVDVTFQPVNVVIVRD